MKSKATNIRRPRISPGAGFAVTLLFAAAGCSGIPLLQKADKLLVADSTHPAVEILAIWQTAEGPGPGGVPVRGFGGQVFFFTRDKPAAAVVDGTVRIYLFDDRGTVKDQAKPIHQFDYDSRAWYAHLQNTHLGPAYSIFIPYTRNDFHQATCAMRIRFVPTNGPTIYSTMSTLVLPGPPVKSEENNAGRTRALTRDGAKPQLPPGSGLPWSDRFNGTDPAPTAFAKLEALANARPAQGSPTKIAQAKTDESPDRTLADAQPLPDTASPDLLPSSEPVAAERRIRVKLQSADAASAVPGDALPSSAGPESTNMQSAAKPPQD